MAKYPFDLPPGILDALRVAEQFRLDPSTERLLRETAKSHAPILKAMHESIGWRNTLHDLQSVRDDYVTQFARIRDSVDAFARIDHLTRDSVGQMQAFHDSWLKQATQAQALIGPTLDAFHIRLSEVLDFTEISLVRIEMLELGAALGLERYSHTFDVTIKNLRDSLAAIYSDDGQALRALPRFVLERPPQELFVHVRGVEAITVEDVEDEPKTEGLQAETEVALLPLLQRLGPDFIRKWQGARQALASQNPDRIAHVSASIRELFRMVLHEVAPEEKVRAWSTSQDDFDRGRPTRNARFRYATRGVSHPPFSKFLARDFSSTLELITLFDEGVHASKLHLTEIQVRLMMLRMDQFLRFLLEIVRESDS